ncbi:hypothetical protein OAJ16_01430 [Deltaproteobacteria bacterium]|nr:hypothetical protein [Deltaproteobacteria bacterium]
MKQLSKMMLAAVASVALAAPAFAWDFGASGSSSATFKQATSAPAEGDATTTANFSSSSGGVTVSSSNSDGANTATFSYTADWNGDAGNFDESVSVSGSKKVGNWTASSSTTQWMQKDATTTTGSTPMGAGGTAAITLTDGSITYKLGDAAHLSTAEKTSGGPMGGAQDAEASVDSFNGFSVGLGVGPGTLTVALDMHSGAAATALGENSAGSDAAVACGVQVTGFGFNFAGDVGADLTFTYGSGSATHSATTCVGDNATNAWGYSVMGLGVAVPVGGMTIAFDYGSKASLHTIGTAEGGSATTGWELSLVMPVGDASAGVNLSSTASITTTGGEAGDPAVTGGTELWYTVPIGPVSLSAGYGSAAVVDGATTTEIGAEMSMSF